MKREMRASEWKTILRRILREIELYLDANIISDDLHIIMLYSGINAAREALSGKDYWPGYCEGVTRVLLTLLGDYPDHRRRLRGRKPGEYYKLKMNRSIQYVQDEKQRMNALFVAHANGFPLSVSPRDLLCEFRECCGDKATYKEFFRWMKKNYPNDYALIS